MTARLVNGSIRERKTVVARFGAPEIMHTLSKIDGFEEKVSQVIDESMIIQ